VNREAALRIACYECRQALTSMAVRLVFKLLQSRRLGEKEKVARSGERSILRSRPELFAVLSVSLQQP
jgi:hypothetical protein